MNLYSAFNGPEIEGVIAVLSALAPMAFAAMSSEEQFSDAWSATKAAFEEKEREALRARHRVRLVGDEEDGFGVDKLPDGIYGFTGAPALGDAPLFSQKGLQNYEVHKLADGTPVLVGFVTEEEAASMEAANDPVTIHLFPDPQERAQKIVSVPLDRILKYTEHSQRMGNGLELDYDPVD